MVKKKVYDADSITWLKGLDGVRKKPALYIGESDSQGVLHLSKEIIGNSIDESVNGHGSLVGVKIEKNVVTVFDQGRGMPVGKHKDNPKMDVLTILATQLHAGGKLDAKDGNYETSLGCFVGDTEIRIDSNGDSVRIEDMYKEFTETDCSFALKAYDPTAERRFPLRKCYNVQLTNHVVDLVDVFLSNKKVVRCTHDHPFILLNGDRVEAQNLLSSHKLANYPMFSEETGYLNPDAYVEKVVVVTLDKPVPVYGLSVELEHNYLLGAGVFVANTHGVGLSVVNALSTKLQIWTFRNRKWYTQSFSEGKPLQPKPIVSKTSPPSIAGKRWPSKGTIIQWTYDPSVFDKGSKMVAADLITWIKGISWFTSHTKGKKRTQTKFIIDDNGKRLNINRTTLKNYVAERVAKMKKVEIMHDTFIEQRGNNYDLVGAWTTSADMTFDSAVNSAQTTFGGTHARAASKAMEDAFKKVAKKAQVFRSTDLLTGFVGCFNLRIPSPRFDSQSKSRLTSPEATKIAYEAVTDALTKWIKSNKSTAQDIIERACAVYNATSNAKLDKQLAAALKTRKAGKSNLPAELIISTTKKPDERELFILEGQSASGGAKKASIREYQEVLPLRGKVLNVAKASSDRMTGSSAIVNLLKSMGYDPKNPLGKLRVGKVVLLTDSDPDGPLAGDTIVELAGRDNMTIGEMAKEWTATEKPFQVYSQTKDGSLSVTEAINIEKKVTTRQQYSVIMENGSHAICTGDHKWAFVPSTKIVNGKLEQVSDGRIITVDMISGLQYMETSILKAGDLLLTKGNVTSPIRSVTLQETEVAQDYYCLTVPQYHNFYVGNGDGGTSMLSSNCHISSLILTLLWQVTPHLFQEGRVYLVDAPLYIYSTPSKKIYASTYKELREKVKGKFDLTNVKRLKGWSEAATEDLKDIAFNPDTRSMIRVCDPGTNAKVVLAAMGSDVSLRQEILGLKD